MQYAPFLNAFTRSAIADLQVRVDYINCTNLLTQNALTESIVKVEKQNEPITNGATISFCLL